MADDAPDRPPPPPPDAGPPALRASDADREQVADALRAAAGDGRLDVFELDERLSAAYGARTRAELKPLVADVVAGPDDLDDLVAPPARRPREKTPAGGMPVVRDGRSTRGTILSVMGGSDVRGNWALSEHVKVISIMGGADIDLNDAVLTHEVTRMTVISIMGGSDIYIPEGVNVEVDSVPIMGGDDIELGDQRPDPGGPVLQLRLVSIMGGNDVWRGRKKSWRERRQERRERRDN